MGFGYLHYPRHSPRHCRGHRRQYRVRTYRHYGEICRLGLTPLQRKMKEFVRTLIGAMLVVGSFTFGLGIYLGYAIS